MDLRALLREIYDFPKEGIVFLDITPLLGDGKAFHHAVDMMAARFADACPTKIVAAEARGFIFGAALAYKMRIGFVPVRKPGKLPYKTQSVTYDLEYGTDTLCMHEDAVLRGEKVLVVDDLLATGGTLKGVLKLVESFGAEIAGVGVLVELDFLNGKDHLNGYTVQSVVHVGTPDPKPSCAP
ncbi:MAG: adenine phosphoribosyltransferase [Desulfovibrio sp.]|nr:adenine phosphoribosyltransferase [Desulfovibrio sp.]